MGEVLGGLIVMGVFLAFVLWANRGKAKAERSIEERFVDYRENDDDDDD